MTWAERFAWRQKLTQSLWFVPLLAALGGVVVAFATLEADRAVALPFGIRYERATTEILLATIAGAVIGLIGLVITVTVLMVQTSTSAFSARYLRILYRGALLKTVLGLLVGTFTYAYVLLRHAEEEKPPEIGVALTGVLVLASIVLFLVFFSRFLHRLRPVAAADTVGALGRKAFLESLRLPATIAPTTPDDRSSTDLHAMRTGTIQAVHADGLVAWAGRHHCTVVLLRGVGDHVSVGDPLVEVRGSPAAPEAGPEIEGLIALGDERTIEQDPAFALRVMVDIAARALSPGINDPTTAVQVLDHIESLLLLIGGTDLSSRRVLVDAEGAPRVIVPTRTWEDFLTLGVTEIRQFGEGSIQVLRRLRALLLHVQAAVRPEHRAAVERELARLDETVQRAYGGTMDLATAVDADRQGLGGPTGATTPAPPSGRTG